ncbi:hypothetical protein [Sphingobium sp.]|uniref:hypothetical protein n=1 Tax=Sphingobium sp. TaxID=1912891 RepID=UPI003B3A6866
MTNAVIFQNITHFFETDLVGYSINVIRKEADASIPCLGSSLYTILERKWADMVRPIGVDITGKGEIGSKQFWFRHGNPLSVFCSSQKEQLAFLGGKVTVA